MLAGRMGKMLSSSGLIQPGKPATEVLGKKSCYEDDGDFDNEQGWTTLW